MKKSFKFILPGIAALLVIAVLVIFIPWATGWAKGVGSAGELRGEYAVGFRRIMAEDPARPETFTEDPGDHRQIMVSVYYPAVLDENTESMPYGNGSRKEIAKAAGFPYFFTAPLKLNRVGDAAPALGQFPVLVFSPGSDGPTAFYATLLEQIASQGYIVLAVDHPYTTSAVAFPDGTLVEWNDAGNERLYSRAPETRAQAETEISLAWANDHSLALDALLNGQPGFEFLQGSATPEMIGAFGHSFGGQSAIVSLLLDDRFSAAMNLDGSLLYPPLLEGGVEQPVALVYSGFVPPYEYIENNPDDSVTAWFGRWQEHNLPPAFAANSPELTVFQIDNFVHDSFAPDILLFQPLFPLLFSEEETNGVSYENSLNTTTDLISAWFGDQFYGTESPLLANPQQDTDGFHLDVNTEGWVWD